MIERLKSWESPRKRGRNDKGKGGTARARQLKKREKLLRKKLKQNQSIQGKKSQQSHEGEIIPPLFFCKYNQSFLTLEMHHNESDLDLFEICVLAMPL